MLNFIYRDNLIYLNPKQKFVFFFFKLPEEIKNYTGLVHVQESRRKRDVDLTEPYVFRNWPNAPIHYNFNYDPKVRVSQNIGLLHKRM